MPSKWTANENPDAEKVEVRTVYLAQIGWREPSDETWAKHYPSGIDYCITIDCKAPDALRERIAHYRFLRGSLERFDVIAWSETHKKLDGHWKLDEKHDLAVRG